MGPLGALVALVAVAGISFLIAWIAAAEDRRERRILDAVGCPACGAPAAERFHTSGWDGVRLNTDEVICGGAERHRYYESDVLDVLRRHRRAARIAGTTGLRP